MENEYWGTTMSTRLSPLQGGRRFLAWVIILFIPSFADLSFQNYFEGIMEGVNPSSFTPIIAMGLSLLVCLLICKPLITEWRTSHYGFSNMQKLGMVLKTFVMMYLINIVISIGLTYIFEKAGVSQTSINQEVLETMAQIALPVFVVFAVISGPITEELLYRGLIFRAILPHNRKLAYIVSSLLFGLVHLTTELAMGQWISMLNILIYASMGFFMARVYEKTEDIRFAMLLHILWNAMSVAAMFI